MDYPTKLKIRPKDGATEILVLVSHPMETGQRKASDGTLVPLHFIQNVTVTHNDRPVMTAQWGAAVAKNPFLHFRFSGGKPGEKVVVTWVDTKGDKRTDEATIAG